ncbi:hypothetical protein LCGC14_2810750 [marine sediment metagenome]|uniref:DUF5655 domain-containing protein n=1 Tax=marine sediment metagenome TaxID=412755 RepID=A0A0F8YJX0_9ZZZZ
MAWTFTMRIIQDKISEDPSILGLGELLLRNRERIQSSGGRVDFILENEKTNTLFEVEVQLGKTDESHIIRTIEYWDLEQRKNPSYEHRAVIVAEEITNRFFNVIYLMNRSIPIIAIQLNALKVDNKITLNFTKVLDNYETPEDEINRDSDEVGKSYWEKDDKKGFQKSLEILNIALRMMESVKSKTLKPTYNKNHIVQGSDKKNFSWYKP